MISNKKKSTFTYYILREYTFFTHKKSKNMNLRSIVRLHSSDKQSKGYVLAFVGIFLSFILSTSVSVYAVKKITDRGIQELNYVISQVIRDHIKEDLVNPIVNSNLMANDEYLVGLLTHENSSTENEIKSYLRGIKNGYGYDGCFVVSEKSKKYYSPQGLKKVISPQTDESDRWYSKFLEKNDDYAITVDNISVKSDKLAIFFDNKIKDKNGQFLGVAGVTIYLEKLQNTIKKVENKFDVKISLIDRNGEIIESDSQKIANTIVDAIEEGINKDPAFLKRDTIDILGDNSRIISNIRLYLVENNKKSEDKELFMKVIFINAVLCVFISLLISFIIQFLMFKTNSLSLEIMKDTLTKAYNRKAYDLDKEKLRTDKVPELTVISVDINGLKAINNTLGHELGDYLIKGLYECLESIFVKIGYIYRIDCDGFIVFLSTSLFELDVKLLELDRLIKIWSKVNNQDLSVSVGFSSRVTYPYMTVDDLIKNANELMSKRKQEYYASKDAHQSSEKS